MADFNSRNGEETVLKSRAKLHAQTRYADTRENVEIRKNGHLVMPPVLAHIMVAAVPACRPRPQRRPLIGIPAIADPNHTSYRHSTMTTCAAPTIFSTARCLARSAPRLSAASLRFSASSIERQQRRRLHFSPESAKQVPDFAFAFE